MTSKYWRRQERKPSIPAQEGCGPRAPNPCIYDTLAPDNMLHQGLPSAHMRGESEPPSPPAELSAWLASLQLERNPACLPHTNILDAPCRALVGRCSGMSAPVAPDICCPSHACLCLSSRYPCRGCLRRLCAPWHRPAHPHGRGCPEVVGYKCLGTSEQAARLGHSPSPTRSLSPATTPLFAVLYVADPVPDAFQSITVRLAVFGSLLLAHSLYVRVLLVLDLVLTSSQPLQ